MTTDLRRKRVAAVGVACAALVLTAGTAVAVRDASAKSRVHVTADVPATREPDSTTANASTSTSTSSPAIAQPDPTIPAVPVPVQPGDIEGTLSFASTTVRVGELTRVTLTVKNLSDHFISILNFPVGVYKLQIELKVRHFNNGALLGFSEDVPSLGPGDSHTFSTANSIGPGELIGPGLAVAEILVETGSFPYAKIIPQDLAGVAPVPITIVPPGWKGGEPLDPSLGEWKAEMSADSSTVAGDGTVVVHANVRNVGDQSARTRGFGSLAIMCGEAGSPPSTFADHVVDAATLLPGAARSFSFALDLADAGRHGAGLRAHRTRLQCSLGLKFDEQDDPYNFLAGPRDSINSDAVVIAVTPIVPATSTT